MFVSNFIDVGQQICYLQQSNISGCAIIYPLTDRSINYHANEQQIVNKPLIQATNNYGSRVANGQKKVG